MHCHIIVGVQNGKLHVRFLDSLTEIRHFVFWKSGGFGQILIHGAGVAMLAIHEELIMKMRASGRASRAYGSQHLTLRDALS